MTDASPERLQDEALTFTRALVGREASPYVVRQYIRAHVSLPLAPVQGFDAVLIGVATAAGVLTRAADAYARLFARRAILRRKLVLLLAILESTSPEDAEFAPVASSPAGTIAKLAVTGIAAVVYGVAGVVILGPLHLASRIAAGRA